jgi:hypothetical protein
MGQWIRINSRIKRRIKRIVKTKLRESGNGLWKKHSMEIAFVMALLCTIVVRAQDGNAGISQANTMVRSYFATGVQLMYAIGAILGLIGAVRVYQKWSHGDHDTGKVAASWFGACIFLVVVATLIQSFFGL